MERKWGTVSALMLQDAGMLVAAFEPMFGYMAPRWGTGRQMAVMNDTEPSARNVAAFQDDLRAHRVSALFHNGEGTDAMAERLLKPARASSLPAVGVTETAPTGKTWQCRMLDALDDVDHARAAPPR
jgi:zinc/manganese transport system substrate-binding protein